MMNKNNLEIFKAAINVLEISRIYVSRSSFEQFDMPQNKNYSVVLKQDLEGSDVIIIKDNMLTANICSDLVIEDKNKEKLFSALFNHKVEFDIKDKNCIDKLMENNEANGFFRNAQLRKLVFPYVRAYFHQLLSATSLPAFELPLLK